MNRYPESGDVNSLRRVLHRVLRQRDDALGVLSALAAHVEWDEDGKATLDTEGLTLTWEAVEALLAGRPKPAAATEAERDAARDQVVRDYLRMGDLVGSLTEVMGTVLNWQVEVDAIDWVRAALAREEEET
jgi:hypothetical protein